MAAELERDGLDGRDAGAAPRLHQELDCNGTGGGGRRRSGRAPKPAARALAYQGGTSRPARNAQPGQVEAGEEPASEDPRGASSEEDEADEEGARIPIYCYGNRAFYIAGTFVASNGHRCEGCVEEEGSPRMSLGAWTTKCTGNTVSARKVRVVDADGQTKRSLRDVLDGLSASEDEGARIPIDYRGNRAFYVEGTFIASNGKPCKGFVEEEGSPPMSFSAWTKKYAGNRLSTREVMVVDADGQTTRRLRDVLDGLSGSEDEEEYPTSQYRGVSWDKKQKQWQVQMAAINVGKKKIYLGRFDFEDEEDAARMFDRGQIAYLGRNEVEFTNFPLAEYSHELDWLEGLGVLEFKARLKAARKKLKKAKKPVTPEAVLQKAGLPSVPGPQQHADEASLGGAELRSAVAPGGPIAAGSWVLLPAGDPGKKSKAKGKKKGARDPRFASFVGRVERIVAGDDGEKWVDIRWLYKPGDIVDGVLPAKLRKRYSAKGTPRELLLSDHIDRNPLESVAGVTEVVHDSALADSAAAREGRAGPLFYRYIFLTKASPAKVVEDADGHLARRMFDGADLEAEGGGASDDDDAMGFALEAHTAGKKKRKAERTPGSAGAAAKKKKPKREKDAKDESTRDPRAWYSDDDDAPERKSSFAKMDLLTNATDVARMDVDMDGGAAGGEQRAQREQILQLIEMSSATGLLRGDEANRLRLLHTLDHPGLAGLKDLLRAARETAGALFNLSDLQNEPEVLQAMREALTIATERAWHYVEAQFQPGTSAEVADPHVRLTDGSDRRMSNMIIEAHLTAAETPGHTDQLLVSVGVGGRTFRGWLAMTKAPAGVAIELERGKA